MNLKIIAMVVLPVILYAAGFASGHAWCTSGQQGAIRDSIDDGAEAVAEVKEIVKWRTKKVNVYVNKIQKITDPTDCLDTPVPTELDDELYEIYKLTGGSEANGTVRVRTVPESSTPGD